MFFYDAVCLNSRFQFLIILGMGLEKTFMSNYFCWILCLSAAAWGFWAVMKKRRDCIEHKLSVRGSESIKIRLSRKPLDVSAGFVDYREHAMPSCAPGQADVVTIEITSDPDGYFAVISWNVQIPRMIEYKICGCKHR